MAIEQWLLVMNVIIAVANIVFILFYYLQLRESKKAVIITSFVGPKKDNGSRQEILENLPQYLNVENISNNKISSLDIFCNFEFNGKRFIVKNHLDYLNPHERAKILIRFGDIVEKYPSLFGEYKDVRDGRISYLKIPIETLNIRLKIFFKWKLFNLQKDEYFIEWLSKKSCPELKYHPRIASWNKRNEIYVEKINETTK